MRYKIGEKVVLRDDKGWNLKVPGARIMIHGIGNEVYHSKIEGSAWIYADDDINHSKTAKLNEGTLEHIVAKKNKVSAEKELGRRLREVNAVRSEQLAVDASIDSTASCLNSNAIKPAHYRNGKIDRIEVWYQTMPFEGFRWAMKSHIDKYIYRYEQKNGVEDLDKATYYIKRLKEKEEERA